MQSSLSSFRFSIKSLGLLAAVLVLAGCSSTQPSGYYDIAHDTTETDAQQKAQGRSTAQAPSQIQFGFNRSEQTAEPQQAATTAAAASTTLPRPLREAKTYLGTVPCLAAGGNCPAQRITLTIAPTGEWRARTEYLDAATAQPKLVQQGCWTITGYSPLRLMLQTTEGSSKGTFIFVNDNVLRVGSLNNATPNLDYRLTQQADIDAIDELPAGKPLQCP